MALTKDPLALSPEQLDALEPALLHSIALQASGCVLRGRLLMGRCLLSMQRTEAYLRYGCSSVIHYAKAWLGCKEDEAYDIRLVALRLEDLPILTEAAETGRIGWCALRAVLRRATPETEAEYLQMAQNNTVGRLEWLLSKAASENGEQSADLVKLLFYVQPDVIEMYQSAVRKISRGMGCRVDPGKVLEYLLAEFHAGHFEQEVPSCDASPARCTAAARPIPMLDAGMSKFSLASHASHCILLRRWGHGARNLVTVCSACHANIHDGNLVLDGMAPAGLTWSTSARKTLGFMPRQSAEHWELEWLDTG